MRYGIVVQANELPPRSVVIVAPTSRSARAVDDAVVTVLGLN